MRILLPSCLLFLAALPVLAAPCPASREFITTLEFLRSQAELTLKDQDAQKIAQQVSQGCEDAAQRFIKVTSLLRQSGLVGKDAVQTGLAFASRTNPEVEAFTHIFKGAFLEDGLDLDLRAALEMARSLSLELKGGSQAQDFDRLIRFCTSASQLNLSRPQCGSFATRIIRAGHLWEKGLSGAFVEAYDFLTSNKGPNLITGKALEIAEAIVAAGPGSVDNFVQAYRYAIAEKGLGLATGPALDFARKMTIKN